MLLERCSSRRDAVGIIDALGEELPSDLNGLETEPAEIVRELVPASAAELVRDGGEPWPRTRTLDGGEDGAREAQIPRDERRWGRRRLQCQPAVIADLVERAGAFGEVDPPRPGGRRPARHAAP